MKFHLTGQEPTANITPVKRDLLQFISPNPRAHNPILLVTENSTFDLASFEDRFQSWEDRNLSAIIIDTRNAPMIRNESYLIKLRETVECPIIRWQTIREQDDIFDARLLQFDAQISEFNHINTTEFMNLYKLSQGIHFRIIPMITGNTDWKIVVPAQPRFYCVDSALESIPPMVRESQSALIGFAADVERFGLKCVIETID